MKQVTLGPKYGIRLSDLKAWHAVGVTCFQCKRTSLVWPDELRKRFSNSTLIGDFEDRLKCTRCTNKMFNSWQIMQVDRND